MDVLESIQKEWHSHLCHFQPGPSYWIIWTSFSSSNTFSLLYLRAFAPAIHSAWAQHLPHPLRQTDRQRDRRPRTPHTPHTHTSLLDNFYSFFKSQCKYFLSLESSLLTHQFNFAPLWCPPGSPLSPRLLEFITSLVCVIFCFVSDFLLLPRERISSTWRVMSVLSPLYPKWQTHHRP